jgi:drug/metabolite transporter (DMT)-like permease
MAAGTTRAPGWSVHASMIALVFLWGLAFVAIKDGTQHMSWVTLTFLRFLFADILFIGYLALQKTARVRPRKQDLPALIGLGFLGFTGYHFLLNLGESFPDVTAGTAALIIASDPAFIALFAVPILGQRLGRVRAAGIALAFVGLGVMIFLARPGSEFRFELNSGALLIVPPALFSAVYLVLGRRYLTTYRPFVFVAYTILIGTVLSVPVVIATWGTFIADLTTMGWAGFLPVLFLSVGPTFIGYGIWFRAVERMPAAAAGAYLYISTLIAVLGGIVLLGEPITLATILGGALVVGGVAVAQHLGKRSNGSVRAGTTRS